METELYSCLEVVGCPTICRHCWAQGVPYQAMPLEDIRHVLQQARGFCETHDYTFNSYPMHEVAAHPEALEVLRLFQEFVTPGEKFVDPLATTGVPIATRDDWSDLLDGLREQRITTLWLAFHGVGEVHDRAVHRSGAYGETLLAAQRAREKGFKVGGNVFITKESSAQVDELAEQLDSLGIGAWWGVASYSPVARLRQHEPSRPHLDELLPISEKLAGLSPVNSDFWLNLAACTEAAYAGNALANGGFDYYHRNINRIVVRPSLDVHSGDARLYGPGHGNLRRDDPMQVFAAALAHGSIGDDTLHYGNRALPDLHTLAEKVGDAHGQCVYPDGSSMRYRWLDKFIAAGKLQ